jgi:hypothetical protein
MNLVGANDVHRRIPADYEIERKAHPPDMVKSLSFGPLLTQSGHPPKPITQPSSVRERDRPRNGPAPYGCIPTFRLKSRRSADCLNAGGRGRHCKHSCRGWRSLDFRGFWSLRGYSCVPAAKSSTSHDSMGERNCQITWRAERASAAMVAAAALTANVMRT